MLPPAFRLPCKACNKVPCNVSVDTVSSPLFHHLHRADKSDATPIRIAMSTSPSQPSFTFTIPSIHDDIDLNCRIYNPPYSKLFSPVHDSPWNPRGAVVAHAYAPLGGCYDDLIVLAVVEECLKKGLVVGTFNFRCVQRKIRT